MMQLQGAYNSYPSNFDFRVGGILFINGESVSSYFYLAHNNKPNTGTSNWWIGTLGGANTSNTEITGMTIQTASRKLYCLSQNQSNYQITVYAGSCLNIDYEAYKLNVLWGRGIDSVIFQPLESPQSGEIRHKSATIVFNGDYSNESTSSLLTFYAKPLNSMDIANSFKSLFPNQSSYCSRLLQPKIYFFQVYAEDNSVGPTPQFLDFYTSGYMIIN